MLDAAEQPPQLSAILKRNMGKARPRAASIFSSPDGLLITAVWAIAGNAEALRETQV
jgi:hypothetical protein